MSASDFGSGAIATSSARKAVAIEPSERANRSGRSFFMRSWRRVLTGSEFFCDRENVAAQARIHDDAAHRGVGGVRLAIEEVDHGETQLRPAEPAGPPVVGVGTEARILCEVVGYLWIELDVRRIGGGGESVDVVTRLV